MTYQEALNLTFSGSLVKSESWDDGKFVFRDLSKGGNSPPLMIVESSGVSEYTATTDDESATWLEYDLN